MKSAGTRTERQLREITFAYLAGMEYRILGHLDPGNFAPPYFGFDHEGRTEFLAGFSLGLDPAAQYADWTPLRRPENRNCPALDGRAR